MMTSESEFSFFFSLSPFCKNKQNAKHVRTQKKKMKQKTISFIKSQSAGDEQRIQRCVMETMVKRRERKWRSRNETTQRNQSESLLLRSRTDSQGTTYSILVHSRNIVEKKNEKKCVRDDPPATQHPDKTPQICARVQVNAFCIIIVELCQSTFRWLVCASALRSPSLLPPRRRWKHVMHESWNGIYHLCLGIWSAIAQIAIATLFHSRTISSVVFAMRNAHRTTHVGNIN